MDNCLKNIPTKKTQPEKADNINMSERQKNGRVHITNYISSSSSLATLWGKNCDNLIWQELGQTSLVIIKKIIWKMHFHPWSYDKPCPKYTLCLEIVWSLQN